MRNKAFTLIELLIVISIVGIISGAIVVQMNGAINAANDATKKVDLNTIKKALTIYQAETGNSLPMESGCTVGSCSNLDSALGDLLPDSFANTYTYSSNGTSYAVSSVLSSGYAYQYNSATNSFETLEPSNGVCGSSNGANLSSAPSTNLCNTGTASSVSSDPGPWTWTCAGTNGGETASCTTGEVPVAGVCGTKNGKYAASTPTGTQACTAGTISNMTGSYSWTCAGSNGGDSPSCATVAAAYTVTSFTTVGTSSWTVPSGVTSVEYLVVGGGGGGGGSNAGAAAGGGAGGLLTGTNLSVSGTVSLLLVLAVREEVLAVDMEAMELIRLSLEAQRLQLMVVAVVEEILV
jgi:prepilin-type N-terminal cleavage/methylation domain-containing protein